MCHQIFRVALAAFVVGVSFGSSSVLAASAEKGKVAFLNGNTKDKLLPYHDNLAAFAVYGTVP